jgi:hypothetical protein
MISKWMLALAAATALVPAAAIAQDGRGRQARSMDNGERVARPDRGGGFGRARPAFRDRPSAPRPAPDAAVRPQRGEGFGSRGERPRIGGERPQFGGGRPDRPSFGEGRPDRPILRPGIERPSFGEGGGRVPGVRPGNDGQRPAIRNDRQRFGGWNGRRSDETLLGRGPEARERFARERQDANRRFDERRGIASGRQDWRGNDRSGDRRWYGDNNWGRSGNDWNRGDRDRGWDRGNWNRGGWDRGWRSDRRYDWRGYRAANRSIYRLPRYYAPQGYHGGYRRFGIGFTLSSILFSQDYWIDDPYDYRLPYADGQYRWVRYYNDALLVDLETGEVVDVEYDIFW